MGRQGGRVRVNKGIYRDRTGYECMVMVAGENRTKRFPLTTGMKVMEEWRFDQQVEIKLALKAGIVPGPKTGTLAADADAYLAMADIRNMPSYRDRKRDIEAWVAVLGHRKRSTITPDEIQAQLETWAQAGASGSTLNHRRTALRHLYRIRDGKHARNPVADVKKAVEHFGDPKGRAIDPMTIAKILRYVRPRSLARVRLALQATTGITPIEITRLERRSFVFGPNQSGSVTIPPRMKGKGSDPREVPFMTVHAWRAALAFRRAYDREKAWGQVFSTPSVYKTFQLAAEKVRTRFRAAGMDEHQIDTLIRPDVRPYDLRHSFGSFLASVTKDDTVAQTLLGHRSLSTTQRYTRASVPDRIAAVVATTHKRQRKAAVASTQADGPVFRYVVDTPTLKIEP